MEGSAEGCSAPAAAPVPTRPTATAAGDNGHHEGSSPTIRKRRRAPKIDIDVAIAKHMEEVKAAAKLVTEAKRLARNEKRRKTRLIKKASSLTATDLERIAVLKRCGLWNPAVAAPTAEQAEAAADEAPTSASSGAASTVCSPASEAAAAAVEATSEAEGSRPDPN